VIFTGYLTHRELRHLFPCCDAAVFPSVVKEAGPLVFLEALASGAFPLGTYFGGMKASIDSVAEVLPPEVAAVMKLDPAPERTVADIVRHVPLALDAGEQHREALFRVARERYDWSSVSRTLSGELNALSRPASP
jgi:glycosyltransferase involved in cell wall biosynthesis